MGHPTAPLMLLLLLCHVSPSAPCSLQPTESSPRQNLANKTHRCAELDWGPFEGVTHLQLSHNGITSLNASSRAGPALEELDLSHNQLRDLPAAFLSQARVLRLLRLQHNQLQALPDSFFTHAMALQTLQLEGNPLLAVPRSAFQPSLRSLDVPCGCGVVGSILGPCTCPQPNCTAPQCRCLLPPHHFYNATDFYAHKCRSRVALVAGAAVAAVVVAVALVVGVVVWYRCRRAAGSAGGVGWSKQEPPVAQRQPRYISRDTEIGTGDAAAAPDYENVFVSHCTATAAAPGWAPGWQEGQYSSQVPVDDDYFLGSDGDAGDQPIYANTRSLGEDNVYIIPNQ
ncbi:leucine-rich repeat-containing protein 25 [Porphyrio hochstetteri]